MPISPCKFWSHWQIGCGAPHGQIGPWDPPLSLFSSTASSCSRSRSASVQCVLCCILSCVLCIVQYDTMKGWRVTTVPVVYRCMWSICNDSQSRWTLSPTSTDHWPPVCLLFTISCSVTTKRIFKSTNYISMNSSLWYTAPAAAKVCGSAMFVSPLPTLEHVRFAKENTLGGDFMGLVMMIMTHCGQTVHQACAVISLL